MISLNGGSNPTTITFNGNDCNEVWYNGTLVWQKKIDVTPSTESYYNGYWELNYPWAGCFNSDTTDYKINFGTSVVNNPLTFVDMEVNYGTYSTSINNFRLKYTWQVEDEEGGISTVNRYVIYKSNTVTPTISVINNGTGKLAYTEGVLYAIRNNLYNKDYILALKLFPSVINSATYTTNLADYLARWTAFCRETEHTETGSPTLSEKPQYSNVIPIYSPTTGCPLYVALPDEPPFEEYADHYGDNWTCTVDWTGNNTGAAIFPTVNSVRFKFTDSKGKTWYTSWITSGIGYGYPAFEIYPA